MNAQKRDRLIWNAVPTVFQVPNPPKVIDGGRKPPTKRKTTVQATPVAKRSKVQGNSCNGNCYQSIFAPK
jgi:hypothetical protein